MNAGPIICIAHYYDFSRIFDTIIRFLCVQSIFFIPYYDSMNVVSIMFYYYEYGSSLRMFSRIFDSILSQCECRVRNMQGSIICILLYFQLCFLIPYCVQSCFLIPCYVIMNSATHYVCLVVILIPYYVSMKSYFDSVLCYYESEFYNMQRSIMCIAYYYEVSFSLRVQLYF